MKVELLNTELKTLLRKEKLQYYEHNANSPFAAQCVQKSFAAYIMCQNTATSGKGLIQSHYKRNMLLYHFRPSNTEYEKCVKGIK